MVTTRGRNEVDAFFRDAPPALMRVLRGAGRAGAKVIGDRARTIVTSDAVRAKIKETVRTRGDRIIANVTVEDRWARSVAIWLEYGTDEHVISVDIGVTGKTPERINKQAKEGSLVIGGNFVGATVIHPGARAHPFMRVALDTEEAAALAEAQRYVAAHVSRRGILPSSEVDE